MKNFKLNQIFYIREERSDFECKVIGIKTCEFSSGEKFIDFLIEKTRLNSYHASFKTKESRTSQVTFRYDYDNISEWIEQNWPGPCSRWEEFEGKILTNKPKDLRIGSNA